MPVMALFFTGCQLELFYGEVQIQDPGEQMLAESGIPGRMTVIPPAADAPRAVKKVVPLKKKAAIAQPQAAKPAAKEAPKTAVKQPGNALPSAPAEPERPMRGPGMWRVFSGLSPEEQKELLKLQRSNPERYREVMQKKVAEFYEQEKLRRQELDQLSEKCRNAVPGKDKEQLQQLLRQKVQEDFRRRLQDMRRNIEAQKHRTAHWEAELQKREQNCDAIIDAIVQKKLTSQPENGNIQAKNGENGEKN